MLENDLFAETWPDFLKMIKEYKEKNKDKPVWFRGQRNFSYTLLPSLFRTKNGLNVEKVIYEKYRQIVFRIQPQQKGEWETLFDMQHNWIPTRLLDWSENLGISVYFAVKYNTEQTDMAIYLLNPEGLNKFYSKKEIPIIPDNPMNLEYVKNYLNKDPFPPEYPIAIRPNFSNNRMIAQRGLFTIHGDNLTPIEQLCPKAVLKIGLSKKIINEANDFLDFANINEYTVFPDINGISDYIRRIVYSE
jgi:hypothetical protein